MRGIFISYRREDAEGQAGRLFDDLAKQFGEHSVFMDVAGIEPGRDFRRAIDEQVASCGVLLAMIGKNWLDAKDQSGRRRLDDPMDFVRLETASAMKREIPVIPVLVQGASMPRAEQLPPDLAELSYRNGVELTHARWDSDVQVLVKALRPHVQLSPPPQSAKQSWGLVIAMSVAAIAAIAVAIAIGGYVVYKKGNEKAEQEATVGGTNGASARESAVGRNGNANLQSNDNRKQDETNNRNGPAETSVDSTAPPQPSLGSQIANRQLMLVNAKTSKCLTIAGGVSTENNVGALQFDCDEDPSRTWRLSEVTGNGVYEIKNVQTSKCLTIAGGVSTENNVPALQFECDGDLSRTWRITDVTGSGLYQIKNVQTAKCLTIAGGVSTENNVPALQFNCDGDLSRHWRIRFKQQ
jgi:cytolethal distending toxin subunit A